MSSSTTLRKVAVILGAGPGTGAGIAKAFASTHRLALLSRSSSTLDKTIASLPKDSISHAFPGTDASNAESIRKAFEGIKEQWPDAEVDLAVFNNGEKFAPGPFLEADVEDLKANMDSGVLGAFVFSQCFLKSVPESGGTLLFSGATMSIRGAAKFGTMAPSKFATRALSQSLAREFGPKGIHVAHILIDGLIDTERVKGFAGEAEPGTRLDPVEIGKAYRYLYDQHPSAWTQELDLRPSKENF